MYGKHQHQISVIVSAERRDAPYEQTHIVLASSSFLVNFLSASVFMSLVAVAPVRQGGLIAILSATGWPSLRSFFVGRGVSSTGSSSELNLEETAADSRSKLLVAASGTSVSGSVSTSLHLLFADFVAHAPKTVSPARVACAASTSHHRG